MRVCLGFIISPVVGALSFAIWSVLQEYIHHSTYHQISMRSLMVPLIIGGYPPGLLLAVPTYFILRHRIERRLLTSAIVGAASACFPWFVLSMYACLSSGSIYYGSQVMMETAIPAAGCGLIAGCAFWVVVH